MVSTRVWIALAGVAVALLGGVACSSGDRRTTKTSTPPAVESPVAPASVAASPAADTTAAPGTALSTSATPSVEEIQALIASMTVRLQQAAAGGPDTPAPTGEEIEAQLLEQLRQLGISV